MSQFGQPPTDSQKDTAPTVAILTLGCKLNIADSEAMARRFSAAGWSVSEEARDAAAVIVNSCSVTHVADAKSRHLVRMARRRNPRARIALTGCMVETASPSAVAALDADLVFRQADQGRLADALIAGTSPASAGIGNTEGQAQPFRTRAFVSAQEGCNDVCAFCIVPKTRGRERSKSIDEVVAEARSREATGALEVVITGTQLGAWGREQGKPGLYPLLRALLERTSIPRIRMSSVQPQDLLPEMVGLWQDRRLCRHFHLALQSGSETVLRRMRRRYTADDYRRAVRLLRGRIPGVAITTDVICGFPGETEAEFEETLAFCREMDFEGMHVFPYSQRLGTVAAKMPGQVPEPVKKERVRRLISLAGEMARAHHEALAGTTQEVLWESAKRDEDGALVWHGLTDTYVRVAVRSDRKLDNTFAPVRIVAVGDAGVFGELVA